MCVRWGWRQEGSGRSEECSSHGVARVSESPPSSQSSSHTGGRDSRPEPGRQGAGAAKRNRGKCAPSARARRAQRRTASALPAESWQPLASAPASRAVRDAGAQGVRLLKIGLAAGAGSQGLLRLLGLQCRVFVIQLPTAYTCPPVPGCSKPLGGSRPRPLLLRPFSLPSL